MIAVYKNFRIISVCLSLYYFCLAVLCLNYRTYAGKRNGVYLLNAYGIVRSANKGQCGVHRTPKTKAA